MIIEAFLIGSMVVNGIGIVVLRTMNNRRAAAVERMVVIERSIKTETEEYGDSNRSHASSTLVVEINNSNESTVSSTLSGVIEIECEDAV